MTEADREEQIPALPNTEEGWEDRKLEEDEVGEAVGFVEEPVTSGSSSNLWPEVIVTLGQDSDSLAGVQPLPGFTTVSGELVAGERGVMELVDWERRATELVARENGGTELVDGEMDVMELVDGGRRATVTELVDWERDMVPLDGKRNLTELVAGRRDTVELVAGERSVTELSDRAQRRLQRQEEGAGTGSCWQPEAYNLGLCGLICGLVLLCGFLMYSVARACGPVQHADIL